MNPLARLAYALQQGRHVADVAWLRSEGEFPDTPSFEFGRVDAREGESAASLSFRARGLVYDRVSRAQLQRARVEEGILRIGAARYRALVLDQVFNGVAVRMAVLFRLLGGEHAE